MARKTNPITFAPPHDSYRARTHRPLNQLALIGPLLAAFHFGSAWLGSDLLVPHYMRNVLLHFGLAGQYITAALIVCILLGQHIVRKDPLRPNGWTIVVIPLEAVLWAVPLPAFYWMTTGAPTPAWMELSASQQEALRGVMKAIGAGVYEEFLFRLVGIHLLLLVCVDLLRIKRRYSLPPAICVLAVAFALCHFSRNELFGSQPLDWGLLTFLTLAGIWWGVLLAWRGYAVAACCHIAWNLYVLAAT